MFRDIKEGYPSAGQAAQLDWPLTKSYESCQGDSYFDQSHMQAFVLRLNEPMFTNISESSTNTANIVLSGEKPVANN